MDPRVREDDGKYAVIPASPVIPAKTGIHPRFLPNR
jgi:hypothetical protein